ncbi:Transposon TX1 uncharacterized protein [Sparassis crispa]|uniref:Transposon TX1 uncharacterized protein n=1 Tax=Sparassis crispa TaxID=139825 RepID=A0A401GN90_9APHY|nr:Transposon TX1 uncharacterized protein [Sparassis crispa]GBE83697.1 Transposon TX1 uncharacterized protein [Sparassis crispa]
MAKLTRDYHESIQQDVPACTPEEREHTTIEALDNIHTPLPARLHTNLQLQITETDVADALALCQSGRAAGINGLIYELWKALQSRFLNHTSNHKPAFNIIQTLTWIYNDIELNGVSPSTEFATGWLCPLYKKKDKREISNYRPITLLNSDYKIFTKALSLKLAKSAPSVIHTNQAGFIPG